MAPKPVRAKQPLQTVKASTPSPAPAVDEWNTAKESDWQEGNSHPSAEDKPSTPANVSLAGLSKEEKEKEMARRREERKAVSRL